MMTGPDLGTPEQAGALDVAEIASGGTGATRRATRRDPLVSMRLTTPQYQAAVCYRQALEHLEAGRGMGPMLWGRDGGAQSCGERLPAQMRALTAAIWARRGADAAGPAACATVINWVVVRGLPLSAYDATRRWREGTAAGMLRAALDRMARAFGF